MVEKFYFGKYISENSHPFAPIILIAIYFCKSVFTISKTGFGSTPITTLIINRNDRLHFQNPFSDWVLFNLVTPWLTNIIVKYNSKVFTKCKSLYLKFCVTSNRIFIVVCIPHYTILGEVISAKEITS